MSKTIKVSEEVYNGLLNMQQLRETFSETILRLLRVYTTLFAIKETLGPSHPVVAGPRKEET